VNIPAILTEQQRELNSWKRLLQMQKSETEDISNRQTSDSRKIMKQVKINQKGNIKALEELNLFRLQVDEDKKVIDARFHDLTD